MIKNNLKKIINRLKNYHPCIYLSLLFLFVPIFIAITRAIYLDNDFWFLVNTGKYIINNGIPHIEPFTIHQGFSFVAQQWLTDIIFYFIHNIFGGYGIFIFTMILYIIILYITYKLCILVSDNRKNLSVSLTFIIGMLLSLMFVRSRPQMFDFIILLIELYLLESYVRKKNNKYLYLLPILSLIMINLHASTWLMLFMFIIPYIIGSWKYNILCFEGEEINRKPLYITIILMVIASFINPYGVDAITYIFTSYGNKYINKIIGEMMIPTVKNISGITIYLSIFMILFLYLVGNKENIKVRYFLLFLGTTYLSLSSVKGFSYFIIASIFSMGDYLKGNFLEEEQYHYSKDFKIKYIFMVVTIVVLLIIFVITRNVDFCDTEIRDTVNYLENVERIDKKKTKIYTAYDDGSYAEYRGLRVYIDPRAEVFLKKNNKKYDVMKEFYLLGRGEYNIEKFLNKYDFDYLIVNKEDYIYKYYFSTDKNTRYKKIFYEKGSTTKHYLYKKVRN